MTGTHSRHVLWGLIGLAMLAMAASTAGASVETHVKDILLNPPDAEDLSFDDISFDAALDRLLPSGQKKVSLAKLRQLGPLDMKSAVLEIDRTTNTIGITGADVLVPMGGGQTKPVGVLLRLDWADASADLTPAVEFGIDARAVDLVYDDLKDIGSKLIPGWAPSPANDIAPTIGIADTAFAFRWDPDTGDEYVDITGAVNLLGVNWGLLLSIDWKEGADEAQVVYGFRASDTAQVSDHITLGQILSGDWGTYATDLRLPEVAFAIVEPEGTVLTAAQLRPIPKAFLVDCLGDCGGLEDDFSVTSDLGVNATLDLDSLGPDIREIYGYEPGAQVQLAGKIGITVSDLTSEDPVDLSLIQLSAVLPSVSGDAGPDVPVGFSLEPWKLNFQWLPELDKAELTVRTAGQVDLGPIDGSSGATLHFSEVVGTISQNKEKVEFAVKATSGDNWDTPFGVDWVELQSVAFEGKLTKNTDTEVWELSGGFTADFELCTERAASGACAVPTDAKMRVEAAGGSEGIKAKFRISVADDGTELPVFAMLDVVAREFGVDPDDIDLGDKITTELRLRDLILSGDLHFDNRFEFEGQATSFPMKLRADSDEAVRFTGYFRFARQDVGGSPKVTFLASVRPTTGFKLEQILGADTPNDLKNMDLPTFGLVVASHPVELNAATINPDAYKYFRGLFGCPNGVQKPSTDPAYCTFKGQIEAGVNMLANVQFPGELAEVGKALWIDTTKGVQFRGTISIPGWSPADLQNVGLGLQMILPEVNPYDAVEFVERGELAIGIRLEGTPDPSVKMFLEGVLETRWRRSDTPVTYDPDATNPGPDPCVLGDAMKQYLLQASHADDNPSYCYDRLLGRVKTELALSPTKVSLSLLLSLEGNSAEGLWEQPFGTPFNLKTARVKFAVEASAPLFNPTFTLGFLGNIQIITSPDVAPTEILLAGAMGIEIVKPAPTPAGVAVTPKFKGIRAYFSRLGLFELIELQKMIYPDFDLAGELGIPPMEFRDGEIMIGLEADVDLCIDQRIGVAAELWLTAEPASDSSEQEQTGLCRPFGADVTPDTCAAKQEEGCFASAIVDLSASGIRVAGAVGAIDLGPVHFDDALVDVRLAPLEQLFVVRGGVTIDGVGSGKLAMKVSGIPDFRAELFGYLEAFGLFEAQIDGAAGLNISAFPPDLGADLRFHAALRNEFREFVRDELEAVLRGIQDDVEDVLEFWNDFEADPLGTIAAARDLAVDMGVPVPAWLDEFVTWTADVLPTLIPQGVSLPSLQTVIEGGTYDGSFDADKSCPFGFYYDSNQDTCLEVFDHDSDGATEDWFYTCPPLTTLDGDRCTFEIVFPALDIPGLPGSAAAFYSTMAGLYEDGIRAFDDLAGLVPAGLDLDDLFDLLAEGLDVATGLVSVECTEFGFDAGDDPSVSAKALVRLLNQPYGFDWTLDMTSLETVGASSLDLVGQLLTAYLGGTRPDISCAGEAAPPEGISVDDFNPLTLTATPDTIDEGGSVTVTGTFDEAPAEPVTVVVNWGDGTATAPFTVSGTTFTKSHTYTDDRPTKTPVDAMTIGATVNGSAAAVTTTSVTVNNVAPTYSVLATPDVDEGEQGTFRIEIFDVGISDRHTVEIDWGDGTSETLAAPSRNRLTNRIILNATHTYLDDEPTATASDDRTISFIVRDDDTGSATGTETATVANVAPIITADTLAAIAATTIVEADEVSLTVSFTDPGTGYLADGLRTETHEVVIDWGDGSAPDTVVLSGGQREATFTHTYADDDPTATAQDAYTIGLSVADDDGGVVTEDVDVTVGNVAPSALAVAVDQRFIDEYGVAMVTGSFVDPGLLDGHTITIDWGDQAFAPTVLTPAVGVREFTASNRYGDNGAFTISVQVVDDDTGTVTATTKVTVRNIAPTAILDLDGTVNGPSGASTFLLRQGEMLMLTSSTEDPGSDDLVATWSWGDGLTTRHTHLLVDGTPDLFPSPSVFPRVGDDGVSDTALHIWEEGCLYEVRVTWSDDDRGARSDRVDVVVTGTDHRVRNPGWWVTELEPGQRNGQALSDATLQCYLRIADHLSSVVGGVRPVGTLAQAIAVLNVSKTSDAADLLDRQILTGWMNMAHGSIRWDEIVDTNRDRVADTEFSEVMAEAERVRLDPDSTRSDLIAQKDRLENVNGR